MKRNRLGIIGNPLGHSLSPVLHGKAIEKLQLGYSYEKWELQEDELQAFIASVRDVKGTILGFNVTIPYKEKIIAYLDKLDENARILGAVNTVKYLDGKLIGYNTDGLGFKESLDRNNVDFKKGRILIIGSGGAAKGIAIYLALNGAADIDIISRNKVKGIELSERITEIGGRSFFFNMEELAGINLEVYHLIIQTTPVGMKSINESLDFPFGKLSEEQVVADIVYNPMDTDFLKKSRIAGAKTIPGLEMLVYQGYHSFKIWTGLDEDTELMLKAGKDILEVNR